MSQGTKYNSTNVETLTGETTLTATSDKVQVLDPDGAKTLNLPDLRNATVDATSGTGTVGTALYADHSSGYFLVMNNASGAEVITIKGWNGSATDGTLGTPTQNESAECVWSGSSKGWIVSVSANS